MTPSLVTGDGRPLTVVSVLAHGGEGVVWTTDRPGLLAKLYHAPPSEAQAAKLAALIGHRPETENGPPPVAWPLDMVRDQTGVLVGIVLPRVRGGLTLHGLCVPRQRRRLAPALSWYRLFDTAIALAAAVEKVHAAGAVIGDLRADNVIVDAEGPRITLIDADSFQIAGHPCPVGSEGTTPPELIGQDFATSPRHPRHDHFGLAVLLHHLLLGVHPFTGVWQGDGDPPPLDQAVYQGLWAQAPRPGPLTPPRVAPPLSALPPPLPALFERAFLAGYIDPAARPAPADWMAALTTAREALVPCTAREGHYHAPDAPCPWCTLAATTGHDPWRDPPGGVAEPRLLHKRALVAWQTGDRVAAADLYRRHSDLHDDPRLPPEIAADAQALPALRQLEAALTRPGIASAGIAALWRQVATAPLAAHIRIEGQTLAAHGALAEARAAVLERLTEAVTLRDLAEAGAWASALFPPQHWEIRPWRAPLSEVASVPIIVLSAPPGLGKHALRTSLRTLWPEAAVIALPWAWAGRREGQALAAAATLLLVMADSDGPAPGDARILEDLAQRADRVLLVSVGRKVPGATVALPRPSTETDVLKLIRVATDMIGG